MWGGLGPASRQRQGTRTTLDTAPHPVRRGSGQASATGGTPSSPPPAGRLAPIVPHSHAPVRASCHSQGTQNPESEALGAF